MPKKTIKAGKQSEAQICKDSQTKTLSDTAPTDIEKGPKQPGNMFDQLNATMEA